MAEHDSPTSDQELLQRIDRLVEEEHRLEGSHPGSAPSGADLERLRQIEVMLDQCWDLLRQRKARREAGLPPGEATARDPDVVENYIQ
ncbi:MAG TPA: DUF2630 family protein [Acidimicrobiales bacterium]|nr:DUF2630 family protein [Acidimicrobiales bacterium]